MDLEMPSVLHLLIINTWLVIDDYERPKRPASFAFHSNLTSKKGL